MSAPAADWAPRLVLRFAIFTGLGLALATAVLVVVVRHESVAQSQRQALDRSQLAVAVLRQALRPADVQARVSGTRRRQLDRLVETRVLVGGIVDVTLYGTGGRMTYTTATGPGGRRAPGRSLGEAQKGVITSTVGVSADGSRRVLRTFEPVAFGPAGARGVVSLEHDYAEIESAAGRSSWLIAGTLEGLLLLLFLILAPVLGRVTSRIRQQLADLEHAATHDSLTGLPNRRAFQRAVDALAAGGSQGAVLVVDLDGFSEVDQILGSESGDALLAYVAERLRRDLGQQGTVARLGEDEFGVVLPDVRPAEIAAVAGQIEAALGAPFQVGGARVAVTVSFGAALLPEHGPDCETVLRRASTALSLAKQPGQGKLQIYDPDCEASDVSRLALTAELREALADGQLLVYYQPQVDLATRAVRGVEALVRWQHPTRGLLGADAFIAQAERSGLATALRAFVLDAAACQWQRWNELGIELELAVNLSSVDMLDDSLPDGIATVLVRYGMPPWNLVLEITERTVVGDQDRTSGIIERLAQLGTRLAIDDFGTGQSSLASLRQFPVQQIKLDRALLACAVGDPAAQVILGSCVEIAHAIGATVVAEGIETQEQRRVAFALGCDIAQGYLTGRPLPADELTPLLQPAPGITRVIAA